MGENHQKVFFIAYAIMKCKNKLEKKEEIYLLKID